MELSTSIYKDITKTDNNMPTEEFSSPPTIHAIPPSPGETKIRSTLTSPTKARSTSSPARVLQTPSRETRTRSPFTSPVKIRFEPYLKARATSPASAQFAMKSLWGQTARELYPEAALMASYLMHIVDFKLIN
jgi:hypothetical protein